jgi:hypothetical protein
MKKIKSLPALRTHLRGNQGQRDRVRAAAQRDGNDLFCRDIRKRLLECPYGSVGPGALHQGA